MADLRRDTALEQRMLEAVIADRNSTARSQQVLVGPSSIGFCRELLRASIFEPESVRGKETHWATAAHVGSVMGEDLERIFGERLGGVTQQRIQAHLAELGVSIEGAADIIFLDDNDIIDLKSTTDIGGVLYDLGKNATAIETLLSIHADGNLFDHWVETPSSEYELTQSVLDSFSKLHYYVQIATYVTGAVQSGVLEEGASGRLVFYDRAGSFQEFVALVVTAEEIALFFELGQRRMKQVVQAQELLEQSGNPALIHKLRDQTPSFCFSPKVMCPLREQCWGGSEWEPVEEIDGPEIRSAVDRYIAGRDMENMGKGMKTQAREELKGISGKLPDGRMVSWVRGGTTINVVETAKKEPEAPTAPTDLAPGEELAQRAEAEGVEIPRGVGVTMEGEVVDMRDLDEREPDDDERMNRLRQLQRDVAAARAKRHG